MSSSPQQTRATRKLCKLLVSGFKTGDQQSLVDELTRLQQQLSRLRRHRQWLQLQKQFARFRDQFNS